MRCSHEQAGVRYSDGHPVPDCCRALAQESDLPEVRWTYPVSLTEIQSKYAMLVNADNMLEKDFEPDPLVKVTGVKRATSAAVYLEETAGQGSSRKCSMPPLL